MTNRLTGLHFTRRDALWHSRENGFEVPDEVFKGNDEVLLCWPVSSVNGRPPSEDAGTTRPSPGLHVSCFSRFPHQNVSPVTGSNWIGWSAKFRAQATLEVLDSEEARAFEQTLSYAARLTAVMGGCGH